MFKKGLVLTLLVSLLFTANVFVYSAGTNLANNGSFESGALQPDSWQQKMWNTEKGVSDFKWDDSSAHTGKKCITITNNKPNHARYSQEIKVKPETVYKFTCWIKSQNVPAGEKGGGIGVEDVPSAFVNVGNTNGEWKLAEMYGTTKKDQSSLSVSVTLGSYGYTSSGTASFDDMVIEAVDKAPDGVVVHQLYPQGGTTSTGSGDPSQQKGPDLFIGTLTKGEWTFLAILVMVVFTAIAVYYLYYFKPRRTLKGASKKKGAVPDIDYKKYLYIILGVGLLFRFIIAPTYKGYHFDYGMFNYWSQSAVKDLFTMYYPDKVYIDYPPAYIIVLFFVGIFNKLFGFVEGTGPYIFMLKLPAMIADVATAYIIFKIAKSRLDMNKALTLAALYIFNPIIWFDTAVWGQVDSVFMLLIIAMFYYMMKDQYGLAAVMLGISIAMKPQGFMFGPVLFFAMLKTRDIKIMLKTCLAGFGTVVAFLLPFTIGNSDPLWFYKLFIKMTDTWKFASINAYNLFALVGANWTEDYHTFIIFTYRTWGDILLVSTVLFTAFFYFKSKNKYTLLFGALFLNVGAFNLSSRMHERYMYPAVIISILIYIYMQERKALHIFVISSATCFINTFTSFIPVASSPDLPMYGAICRVPKHDPILLITSAVNVALMVYIIKFTVDVMLKNKTELKEV